MGSDGSTTGSGGIGDAGDSGDGSSGRLDVGSGGGGAGKDCTNPGSEDLDFSYIWIANSIEGTVSKIDTRTRVELGRYRVSASPSMDPQFGGPSRTSVNMTGDVGVTDRDGGVAKILARPEICKDQNGNGTIETSTGPDDVLPFGEDECLAWRTSVPRKARPAAWTRGSIAPDGCIQDPGELWVAAPKEDGSGGATVFLLDGDTGQTIDEIEIASPDCRCPMYGLYGGAVDGDGNLWTFPRDRRDGAPTDGNGPLIRVNYDTRSYDVFPKPEGKYAYGITVDRDGRPWMAGDYNSVLVFEPADETWNVIDVDSVLPSDDYVLRGLMQDDAGDVWIAAMTMWGQDPRDPARPGGVLRIDGAALAPRTFIDRTTLEELIRPAGISIDVDGYVWLVDTDGNQAFKIDPHDSSYEIATGLSHPYTYSDMTGFALRNAGVPEG